MDFFSPKIFKNFIQSLFTSAVVTILFILHTNIIILVMEKLIIIVNALCRMQHLCRTWNKVQGLAVYSIQKNKMNIKWDGGSISCANYLFLIWRQEWQLATFSLQLLRVLFSSFTWRRNCILDTNSHSNSPRL